MNGRWGVSQYEPPAPAATAKNRKDPSWRQRTGFDNVYKKRIWSAPFLVAGARRQGIHLGILALCLIFSSCAGRDFCRDAKGRFERCPSKRVLDVLDAGYPSHLEPMGADYNGKDFWCVDRKGDRWLSRGECD